jgi:SAM-dependent methyltransferase
MRAEIVDDEVYYSLRQKVWGKSEEIIVQSFLSIQTIRHLLSRFNITKYSKVLDACCASGGISYYIAKKFDCHVFGVDIDKKSIEIASKKKGASFQKLNFICFDLGESIPFENQFFDAILCLESIIYFDINMRRSLANEFFRILSNDGKIIISDPCVINGVVSSVEIDSRSFTHEYFYSTVDSHIALYKDSGFKIDLIEDITKDNAYAIPEKMLNARKTYSQPLIKAEGRDLYLETNLFLEECVSLYKRKVLCQYAFHLSK